MCKKSQAIEVSDKVYKYYFYLFIIIIIILKGIMNLYRLIKIFF